MPVHLPLASAAAGVRRCIPQPHAAAAAASQQPIRSVAAQTTDSWNQTSQKARVEAPRYDAASAGSSGRALVH